MTGKDLDICKHAGEGVRATQQLRKALRRSRTIEKLLLAVVILTVAALPTTIVNAGGWGDGSSRPVATSQLVRTSGAQPSQQ